MLRATALRAAMRCCALLSPATAALCVAGLRAAALVGTQESFLPAQRINAQRGVCVNGHLHQLRPSLSRPAFSVSPRQQPTAFHARLD